jgi:cytochrome c biogenesis protein CcmG/thiol:disulfide interchange protein DsbE
VPADDTLDEVREHRGADSGAATPPGPVSASDDPDDRPPGRPARVTAVVVAVVVIGFIAVLVSGYASRDDDPDSGPSPLDGKVAPALVGPTLDGGTFDLASERGNWVVVNFFATWCVPCLQEHPELQRFAERNAGTNRRVVGVVFGGASEVGPARAFMRDNGGDWPVVIDQGRIAVDYAVPKVPESILVSPTGLVYTKLRGGVTADDLDKLIDEVEQAAGAEPTAPAQGSPASAPSGGGTGG